MEGTTASIWSPASHYARMNKLGILRPPYRMCTSAPCSIPAAVEVVDGCCGGGECEEEEEADSDITREVSAVLAVPNSQMSVPQY